MSNPANIEKLALLGGPKAIQTAFRRYNPIGAEEVEAAKQAIGNGNHP